MKRSRPHFTAYLLMCLLSLFVTVQVAQAQTTTEERQGYTVTGVVVDENGDVLPGATVKVQKNGVFQTVTNSDGEFRLSLPQRFRNEKGAILDVSYIGFKTTRRALTPGKTNYRVMLNNDPNSLDEVVITGFNNIDARKNTSAITSLKMSDILQPGMTNLTDALEGRVPDLMFMRNSGEVGATARLRVRGTSTLIGNREPLWVLDGIPLTDPVGVTNDQLNDPDYINYIGNAISGINPEDIERVDILKDAAATALYGTRAANGVIVVTTKKGQIGKAHLSYSVQTKLIQRPRYTDGNINLMNSQERVQFGKDLVDMHYSFPSHMTLVGYEGAYKQWMLRNITYDQFVEQVQQSETVNTDWFKLLTHEALTQTHTLSLSGGSENTRYYASLGVTDENGVVKTQSATRYTGSVNLQTNVSRSFQVNFRLNASVAKNNYLPEGVDALGYAYRTTRALPAYNPDGSLYFYQRHAYNNNPQANNDTYKYRYNIINEISNASNVNNSSSLLASLNLVYRLKNLFEFQASPSYQRSTSDNEVWWGEKSAYVAHLKNGEWDETPVEGTAGKSMLPYGGVLNTNHYTTENFNLRLQSNYHQAFGKHLQHLVAVTLGYEVTMYRNNGYADQTRGYFKDRGMKYITSLTNEMVSKFPYYADWLATPHRTLTSNKTNRLSGYLTMSYSYKDYVSLNANGRFDASNKFGSRSNEKFLPVWSVSGMVNLKDVFMKKLTILDDLRIRTSYGKTGNMVDGQTPNLLVQLGSLNAYYNENEAHVSAYPNPNLKWEQTDQVNIGLDASLFARRLVFGVDIYYKKTSDAFTTVNVPSTNGVTSYVMNGGDIINHGYSFSISGYPIKTADWSWYVATNYSFVRNKVKSDIVNEYNLENYLNGTALVGGESIGTFYSYNFLGLNPKNGAPLFDDYYDRQHLLEGKSMEEVVKMVMVNSGSREPNLNGSIYNTLTYKQWSLNTNFTYSLGNKIRKFVLYSDIVKGVSSENNVRKEFLQRWLKPGDERFTNYPALISPGDPNFDRYIYHWSTQDAGNQRFKSFARNIWDMYDFSNVRVVSGNYLRLSQITLRYRVSNKVLKSTPFSDLSVDCSASNVFTIASSKLDGQDPTQSGFGAETVLSIRPSYTLGLRITFK